MLNRAFCIGISLAILCASDGRAASTAASKAFQKIDVYAKQQKYIPITEKGAVEKQSKGGIRQIHSVIDSLTLDQLVDLIAMSRKKIHEIPSDSKHELYFNYFEEVIHFSIRHIGKDKTPGAKEALLRVKPIISGAAALTETWDEAYAEQANTRVKQTNEVPAK
ncbi:MAG: hypothetical protein HYX67_14525 [Candidatus Melainabacteria bacterium]|nr:hypothetical protein [Candidatus Melainabacteria bacterium]